MLRIDRLITPSGWIARARMYSLVFSNNRLYLINTGKAANPTQLFNPLKKYRVRAELVQEAYNDEICVTENKISEGKLDELVASKFSRNIGKNEIEELLIVDSVWKGLYVSIKACGQAYKLFFEKTREPELKSFIEAIDGDCEHA